MSTATMRLRRAGAGGLAAAVIAGTLVATAGSALAWSGNQFTPTVASPLPVIAPGSTGPGADVNIGLPKTWSIGDTLNVSIANPVCTDATQTVGFATLPTVTASLGSAATATDKLPTFSVAVSQAGAGCSTANVDTGATLTFTNNGTNSADGIASLNFTGHTFSVASGSKATSVDLAVSAYNAGSTTAVFGPVTASDAVISPSSVLVSSASPVVVAPNTAGQAVPTVTVKEIVPKTISGGSVTIAYSNATVDASNFGTTGTAKATWTGGGTLTVKAGTNANEVEVDGLTATTTTAGTLTLSGVTIKPTDVATFSQGLVVSATASGTGITGTPSADVAADVAVGRVGGSDRYYTAAALYNLGFPVASDPKAVILASGANFPDALSASALAGSTGAGILLTAPDSLSAPAQFAITARLKTLTTVYIIGGTGAVSAKVAAQVAALGTTANPLQVIRLGGTDRYSTDQLVNDYANSLGGGLAKTAVVATGTNFADALAVGPEVVNQNLGMVLTDPNSLSASAQAALINNGFTSVVIVGGTGAVSANVESQITALGIKVAYRLAGADRTQTAEAIANWATIGVPAVGTTYAAQGPLGFERTYVHVARGDIFADALAAGPVAAGLGNGTVILLTVNPTTLGAGAPAFVSGLATTTATTGNPAVPLASNIGTVNGLGLGGAVPTSQLNSVALGILG